MKSFSFIFLLFLSFFININAQDTSKINWLNMYPLNDGDYWVTEFYSHIGLWQDTDTRRIVGDTLFKGAEYKLISCVNYYYDHSSKYYEFVRIDSLGDIYKIPHVYENASYDSTERLYLKMNVEVGDTFSIHYDDGRFPEFWECQDIWYDNDSLLNIYYWQDILVAHSIQLRENYGVVRERFEGGMYCYLTGSFINGKLYGDTSNVTALEKDNSRNPQSYILLKNYPNPFNNTTIIPFFIITSSEIKIDIYNIQGRLIKTLFSGKKPAGMNKIAWNGKTNAGANASNGVYIVQLSIKDNNINTLNRKIILLK